jgi:hypothetical protein
MQAHAAFVWEKYVQPSSFNKLYIVAHSAGGSCLSTIQTNFSKDPILISDILLESDFYERTQKIALTDSWAIGKDELTKSQA